jgi:membrane protease YdiL (CAAX protease family)
MLGSDAVLERAQRWIGTRRGRIVAVPAALWALYLVYSWGMGIASATAATTMAVYLNMPFAVLGLWPAAEPLVILWIWLPLEFGIIRELLIVRAPGGDLHYAFAQLLAIDAGIIAFLVWNRTPGAGYRFEWDGRIVRAGIINFIWFATIAIPIGFAIQFIRYSFTPSKLTVAAPAFAGIFLLTALPEEFLFRGLIQNWIERRTGRRWLSLIIASVIFGAAHLNNGLPVPNYRYFLMATIAGIFYGRAWRTTGSLMASSSTHALVDTVWTVMFR